MNQALLMTATQFAARRGVGKSAVSNWKKAGLVVYAEGEDGRVLVDVVRTEAKLNAKLDPTRGRPTKGQAEAVPELELQSPAPGGAGRNDLGEVRTDLLREQRDGQRLKNAREAGRLVPLAEYERRSSEMGRLARERVHAAVQVVSEKLAAEREPRGIIAILAPEIDRVFAGLADQLDAEPEELEADDLAEVEEPEEA